MKTLFHRPREWEIGGDAQRCVQKNGQWAFSDNAIQLLTFRTREDAEQYIKDHPELVKHHPLAEETV